MPTYDELYQRGLYYASRDVIPAAEKFAYEYGMAKLRITDALYGAFSPIIGCKDRTEVANNDKARKLCGQQTPSRSILKARASKAYLSTPQRTMLRAGGRYSTTSPTSPLLHCSGEVHELLR